MMPTKPAKFDFETYAIQQFEAISKKLDGLNTAFVPREEILLMRNDTIKSLTSLTATLEAHTNLISELKTTDDRQQGRIDAQRNWISILVGLSAAVAGLLVWVLSK
jgi:hypothetical protein